MPASSSYNASTVHRDLDSEVQRLRTQVRLSWEKEARTLAGFGLLDGLSVLELGSGPGFFTEQLLDLLPQSPVTALEIDPVLLERAKLYLQGQTSERLSFVQASVMDTGLPANSFDFAIARLLFCHLPEPVGAAKELLRVLKPGGKLVIIDADRGLQALLAPPLPEFDLINERVAQFLAKRGGNAYVGRQLWRILQAAGFVNLDLEAVVYHSDAKGIKAFLPQFDPEQVMHLAKQGMFSEEEAGSIIASWERFLNAPNPLILMLWLMAYGEKPQLVS